MSITSKVFIFYFRNFQNLNDHLDFCCKTYPKFQLLISEFEKKDICKSLKIPVRLFKTCRVLVWLLFLHVAAFSSKTCSTPTTVSPPFTRLPEELGPERRRLRKHCKCTSGCRRRCLKSWELHKKWSKKCRFFYHPSAFFL